MKTIVFACILLCLNAIDLVSQKIEVLRENESVFLVDKTGSKQKKIQYNYVYSCAFSKDFIIAEKKEYYLIDIVNGQIIELSETSDDLKIDGDTSYIKIDQYLRYMEKGKMGILRLPDKIIVPAKYTAVYPEDENAAFFLLFNGKNYQFFYPQSGKYSIPFQVQNASVLYLDNGLTYLAENEVFPARAEGNIHFMKADGTNYILDKIFSKDKEMNFGGMSMILCTKDGKYGYVDEYANIQIPFIYEWAEPMEGTAIVKYNGKYGLIRDNGEQTIPCVYDKIVRENVELYQATKDGKQVKLLDNGNPYDEVLPYSENNKYIFATEDKSVKILGAFDKVKPFKFGIAPVKTGSKWGYILPTGHYIISAQFEDAEPFNAHNVAPVKLNGKWGVIDFTGKFICEAQFDSINYQDDNVIKLINKTAIYELGIDNKIKLVALLPEKGNIIDPRDSKSYKTVKIGSQIWMAQNLDYKTEESWCYENNDSIGAIYGRLYTWRSAQNACPEGWHLPSDDEWKILERTIGMSEEEVNTIGYNRGAKEATMFRPGGSLGFDIQLSGFLHGYNNFFYKIDDICIIWTSTINESDCAFTRTFYANSDMLSRDNDTFIQYGLPVRCLKD